MAIIYPQIQDVNNPPTVMGSPGPVGTVTPVANPSVASPISRAQVERYLDSVRGQGLFGAMMNLPAFRDQLLSQIPESSAAVARPPMRVPLSPPAGYNPGVDPAFNYFDSNPQVTRESSVPLTESLSGAAPSQADAAVAAMMAQQDLRPVAMEEGGLVGEAKRVQQQGRNGDTMLVHMHPDEYNAMMALGGLGGLVSNGATINPETGLPEMFSFKDILPTIVGVAGAAFGLPTWAIALGTGATTAITTGDIGKGILSGLGSYALGSLFGDIGASGVADPTIAANAASEAAANTAAGAAGSGAPIPVMNAAPSTSAFPNAPQTVSLGSAAPSAASAAPSVVPPPASGPINFTGGNGFLPSTNFPATGFTGDIGAIQAANESVFNLAPGATDAVKNAQFLSTYKDAAFQNAPFSNFGSAATAPSKLDFFGEGISKIGTPGGVGYLETAGKGLGGLGLSAAGAGFFDPEPVDYSMYGTSKRTYDTEPVAPLQRELLSPPEDYSPGFDPGFKYFAANGKRGELDMTMGGLIPDQARNAVAQSAQQIASNAVPQMRSINPAMYSPNAALRAVAPTMRMANGGVPADMAMAGLMEVASDEVKNNLEERMSVPSAMNEPQDAEERIIYDNAMLAVQGVLDPEPAQRAIQDFIETFGYDAYEALVASAGEPRDKGGVIKPANGETTVEDGAIQGEDVIAGMIVDPQTGEASANLRVGENEYVEPADSLARRAKAAGLPPTPKNGAMVRSMEEDQLMAAYG